MKKNRSLYFLLLLLVAGLSLLLYPTVSNFWNQRHQTFALATYKENVDKLDQETIDQMLGEARAYNGNILKRANPFYISEEEKKTYEGLLNLDGKGIIGSISIPCINLELPIYHGQDDMVLATAVGHLDWSSLPVGGESTHSVLSGHRGLPSARLFTDLGKLKKGDRFMITVLKQELTYEVDQILTVLPDDISALGIVEGMDYCTLVTCTPYGVNTHRLLVRGTRVEADKPDAIYVPSDAYFIDSIIVGGIIAVPILLMILVLLYLKEGLLRATLGNDRT